MPPGPVGRHSNKETWPTKVGYAALFDTLTWTVELRGRVCLVVADQGARVRVEA